jgi:tetratricopeptide (TPR) repeat protein
MRKLVFIAATFVCALGLAKADPADDAFARGDFAAAEQAYQTTLATAPDDAAALAGLARLRLYQDKRDEAGRLAQHALQADPANAIAKRVVSGAAARGAAFEHVVLPAMEIGGVRVEAVPASVLPTRAMMAGRTIDGIIGTGLLMHFLATLNYAEGVLTLRPRSASAEFEGSVSENQRMPMWLVGDHFLFARGHINDGPEGLFNIDTGLEGAGIQASRAALEAAGVSLDETAVQTGTGGGGPVRFIPFTASATLGTLTVPDLKGIYTPDGDPYGLFSFAVAGTISHQFFRERTVTFDFDAMALVMR